MFYGYNGFGAFGADLVFNADQVWADQVAGSPKSAGGGGDNARGNKWANMMRAALNDVGNYGLAIPGGMWGSADISAWKDFASKHGLPAQPFPTREGLVVLEQAIGDGGKITSATSEKGVIITTGQSKAGPSTAGLTGGQMAIVAVGALAIIGGLAFFAKKKKAGVAGKSGALALHSGGKHHANRRRRARRARRNTGGHKKIDIFVRSVSATGHLGGWHYAASTNSFPTCKAAKAYWASYSGREPKHIACHFAR